MFSVHATQLAPLSGVSLLTTATPSDEAAHADAVAKLAPMAARALVSHGAGALAICPGLTPRVVLVSAELVDLNTVDGELFREVSDALAGLAAPMMFSFVP